MCIHMRFNGSTQKIFLHSRILSFEKQKLKNKFIYNFCTNVLFLTWNIFIILYNEEERMYFHSISCCKLYMSILGNNNLYSFGVSKEHVKMTVHKNKNLILRFESHLLLCISCFGSKTIQTLSAYSWNYRNIPET